jgi:hypothetical protein
MAPQKLLGSFRFLLVFCGTATSIALVRPAVTAGVPSVRFGSARGPGFGSPAVRVSTHPSPFRLGKFGSRRDGIESAPYRPVAGESMGRTKVLLYGPAPLVSSEAPNRREDLFGAPRPPLAAPLQAAQSRLVVARILLMPAFGGATVKLPGGKGFAAIAAGDSRGWNPKLEPLSVVRIKGCWVPRRGVEPRSLT